MTLFYQGAPRTDYSINYVTYYTFATVWVAYVVPVFAASSTLLSRPFCPMPVSP